jgi:hypothetical protein
MFGYKFGGKNIACTMVSMDEKIALQFAVKK